MTQKPLVTARGGIWQEVMPVLAHHGTSYTFFDEVDALMKTGCR
jgi:hypothetical protein